jgi:adenosylcobyric acid synthase
MAKSLMIQGTGSGVGKSLMVTALCRLFKDMGMDVAPFKAQNMALNAYVTKEGGEIGVAQALQAQAARIEPEIDMNPILLKPSGKTGVQVVIHGKAYSTMKAKGYYGLKNYALDAVRSSFERISKSHELIIIEGAGSPAEINLTKDDIVNMAMARYANAPVLLVGDIDKGGVFASFYGTIELLKDDINPSVHHSQAGETPSVPLIRGKLSDADYIKAFIINKFRGDLDLLKPALRMIKSKTGRPVIGVIPYMHNIGLPEEDGTVLEEIQDSRFKIQNSKRKIQDTELKIQDPIKIVVVKLPYISNFTDFEPFYYEPDVELVYSNNQSDIEHADIVIIPGTKNTMDALTFLKQTGLADHIRHAYSKGIQIIGICGGYQILGERLLNPYGVEGRVKTLNGIGILSIKTVFQNEKITSQVEAEVVQGSGLGVKDLGDMRLKGYEIHHGISTGDKGLFRLRRDPDVRGFDLLDGSTNRNCWGTYIHGIFDNDKFRRAILNNIRIKKGLTPLEHTYSYAQAKDKALDHFAGIVKQHLDMEFIKRLIRV